MLLSNPQTPNMRELTLTYLVVVYFHAKCILKDTVLYCRVVTRSYVAYALIKYAPLKSKIVATKCALNAHWPYAATISPTLQPRASPHPSARFVEAILPNWSS